MAKTVKDAILMRAAKRARLIVNAGGTTHKGTIVVLEDADDYFGIQTTRTAIPGAEGSGLTTVHVSYAAVAWWVDL